VEAYSENRIDERRLFSWQLNAPWQQFADPVYRLVSNTAAQRPDFTFQLFQTLAFVGSQRIRLIISGGGLGAMEQIAAHCVL